MQGSNARKILAESLTLKTAAMRLSRCYDHSERSGRPKDNDRQAAPTILACKDAMEFIDACEGGAPTPVFSITGPAACVESEPKITRSCQQNKGKTEPKTDRCVKRDESNLKQRDCGLCGK
jgi:hypothetical protein